MTAIKISAPRALNSRWPPGESTHFVLGLFGQASLLRGRGRGGGGGGVGGGESGSTERRAGGGGGGGVFGLWIPSALSCVCACVAEKMGEQGQAGKDERVLVDHSMGIAKANDRIS